MLKDALLSLWRSQDSTRAADFVCSGFFIAPACILTAAHALDKTQRWVRPQADAASSFPITAVDRHRDLDVALVRIEVMPAGAISLSPYLDKKLPPILSLQGYFEADPEAVAGVQALNFDSANRHYRLDIKQPEGHSGSALCVAEKVWGMAIRHYADANIHRGCALAVHQFWDWLCDLLPDLGKVKPPPQWDEWVASARSGMAQAFNSVVFSKFSDLFKRHSDGLPEPLNALLTDRNSTPATLGENCVEALIVLVEQSRAALLDGSLALSSLERQAARASFLAGMGCAARLCLDPARLHAQGIDPEGKVTELLDVQTFTVPGATLAVRPKPQQSWTLGNDQGIPSVQDRHASELPVEIGEGDARKEALAIAAHKTLSVIESTPGRIDAGQYPKIHARAVAEARRGRARFLVFLDQLQQPERSELQAWVAEKLGVRLLVVNQPESEAANLYLFQEEELLAQICQFLSLLSESPWSVT